MTFNEVTRSPVYVQVAEQLRAAIFAGELAAGAELPTERALSQAFGASRASVREALRVLQAQGLITTGGAPARAVVAMQSAGPAREALATLMKLGGVALGDLVDLRCVLESAALRTAARRVDHPLLAQAHQALDDMRAADLDIEAFDEADLRFHIALVRAAGNEAMHLVMLALRDAALRYLLVELRSRPDPRRVLRRLRTEHGQILDAVEAHEGDRAAELVESHIRRFYRGYARRAAGPNGAAGAAGAAGAK